MTSEQKSQKTFKCLSCGTDIRLARKDDNSGWDKFNLDGSIHIDQQKKRSVSSPVSASAQSPPSDSSTEALLRLILLEQRTNFEKVNSTLAKLNNTLDALSTTIASMYELQRHRV
jgi:hypothetical protein